MMISVADPVCLSQILDPDSYPSRIPDRRSLIQQQHQKRRGKFSFVLPLFVAVKYRKIVNNLILEQVKKFI
jgi:hypothetical protein